MASVSYGLAKGEEVKGGGQVTMWPHWRSPSPWQQENKNTGSAKSTWRMMSSEEDWTGRAGGLDRQGRRIGQTGEEDWTDRGGGLDRQGRRIGLTGEEDWADRGGGLG